MNLKFNKLKLKVVGIIITIFGIIIAFLGISCLCNLVPLLIFLGSLGISIGIFMKGDYLIGIGIIFIGLGLYFFFKNRNKNKK